MGKEAALLVTSGTQANLVSLMSNTQHGDLVIVESESHMYWYEVGGISAVAGLLPWPVRSSHGAFAPEDVEAAIRPENIHFPQPSLLCVENTHNRHGGTVVTPDEISAVAEVANAHGLRVYMDGARIFNASVAMGLDVKQFTRHVDNLMFCLSKGLSCPVGSLVVGDREFVARARKNRKVLGGGMRQAGIIAAPGIVALENMVDRLAEDHVNARRLAEGIAKVDGLSVDLKHVQTNMVLFDVGGLGVDDARFLSELRDGGVLGVAVAKGKIRLVTHRGIEREHVEKALDAIRSVAEKLRGHS
jgi:threonine aldolase